MSLITNAVGFCSGIGVDVAACLLAKGIADSLEKATPIRYGIFPLAVTTVVQALLISDPSRYAIDLINYLITDRSLVTSMITSTPHFFTGFKVGVLAFSLFFTMCQGNAKLRHVYVPNLDRFGIKALLVGTIIALPIHAISAPMSAPMAVCLGTAITYRPYLIKQMNNRMQLERNQQRIANITHSIDLLHKELIKDRSSREPLKPLKARVGLFLLKYANGLAMMGGAVGLYVGIGALPTSGRIIYRGIAFISGTIGGGHLQRVTTRKQIAVSLLLSLGITVVLAAATLAVIAVMPVTVAAGIPRIIKIVKEAEVLAVACFYAGIVGGVVVKKAELVAGVVAGAVGGVIAGAVISGQGVIDGTILGGAANGLVTRIITELLGRRLIS